MWYLTQSSGFKTVLFFLVFKHIRSQKDIRLIQKMLQLKIVLLATVYLYMCNTIYQSFIYFPALAPVKII